MTRQIREDRRAFLRRLQAVVAGGTAFTLLPQLDLIGRAMAADALPGNDYKALVCIFLFGGSDSFNMLIPHETGEYQAYSTSRNGVYDATANPTGLGYARDQLVTIADTAGKTWGLNPGCTAMRAAVRGRRARLPRQRGAAGRAGHQERGQQQAQAAAGLPVFAQRPAETVDARAVVRNTAVGWGGALSDYMEASNTGLQSLSPSISIAGGNMFQVGRMTLPFTLSSGGPPTLTRFRNDAGNADRIRYESLRALVDASYSPVLQDEYALVGESAIELNGSLHAVLDPANGGDIATVFPAGGTASQLRMVARMIKASRTAAIGHRRQGLLRQPGRLRHPRKPDGREWPRCAAQAAGRLAGRIPRGVGRDRFIEHHHHVHDERLRAHPQQQWQRHRPRLGWRAAGDGWRGRQWRAAAQATGVGPISGAGTGWHTPGRRARAHGARCRSAR